MEDNNGDIDPSLYHQAIENRSVWREDGVEKVKIHCPEILKIQDIDPENITINEEKIRHTPWILYELTTSGRTSFFYANTEYPSSSFHVYRKKDLVERPELPKNLA